MPEPEDKETSRRECVDRQPAQRRHLHPDKKGGFQVAPHDGFILPYHQFFSVCGPIVFAGPSGAAEFAELVGSSAIPSLAAKSASAWSARAFCSASLS